MSSSRRLCALSLAVFIGFSLATGGTLADPPAKAATAPRKIRPPVAVQVAPQDESAEAPTTQAQPEALNERYPNSARPPWTGPYVADDSRPGVYDPYLFPRVWPSANDPLDAQTLEALRLRGILPPGAYHPYAYNAYGCGPGGAGFGWTPGLGDAYLAGRMDQFNFERYEFNILDMNRRKERILSNQQKALVLGLERLRDGDYARSVVALSMAADLDQGDPACRIHLAQARLALGHYDEAGKVLRRALQLQPKLAYADLHIERYYPTEQTLESLTNQLVATLRSRRVSADELFLAGYLEYQRGRFTAAYNAFSRVAESMRDDSLTRVFLGITRPAVIVAEASGANTPGR